MAGDLTPTILNFLNMICFLSIIFILKFYPNFVNNKILFLYIIFVLSVFLPQEVFASYPYQGRESDGIFEPYPLEIRNSSFYDEPLNDTSECLAPFHEWLNVTHSVVNGEIFSHRALLRYWCYHFTYYPLLIVFSFALTQNPVLMGLIPPSLVEFYVNLFNFLRWLVIDIQYHIGYAFVLILYGLLFSIIFLFYHVRDFIKVVIHYLLYIPFWVYYFLHSKIYAKSIAAKKRAGDLKCFLFYEEHPEYGPRNARQEAHFADFQRQRDEAEAVVP